jgi:hypothetical protein
MARDNRRLAEVARSLHRASERLWARVAHPARYSQMSPQVVADLQRLTTDISRAITKLKLKGKK